MTKINSIIEELKSLTLLEASELVSQIEKVFNVDASAASGAVMPSPQIAGTENSKTEEKVEEKTSFDVIIESIPDEKRLDTLKILRKISNLAVSEVKAFTNSLPKTLVEGKSKEEVENIKKQLEVTGTVVKIV